MRLQVFLIVTTWAILILGCNDEDKTNYPDGDIDNEFSTESELDDEPEYDNEMFEDELDTESQEKELKDTFCKDCIYCATATWYSYGDSESDDEYYMYSEVQCRLACNEDGEWNCRDLRLLHDNGIENYENVWHLGVEPMEKYRIPDDGILRSEFLTYGEKCTYFLETCPGDTIIDCPVDEEPECVSCTKKCNSAWGEWAECNNKTGEWRCPVDSVLYEECFPDYCFK